ncbi:cilia- and flagella-associated protein 107 [Numenius arquata]|uniref:cilia- and flagella-associated protein 107 n=1 Tax=Numenius arquata TaxID=31919 RepID=UPI003D304829
MFALQRDGDDWWKVKPKYSSKVLIANWLEEREKGLPIQHFFTHHEEPRSRNLVSEYDDKYNRHGYNPVLPPLRSWNGHKLSWIPQKSDFPILEPPANYGLFEYLRKKWREEEAGVMNSVYTVSYELPLISSCATCQLREPAKIHYLPPSQGHLQALHRILGYEGGQKYLQAIGYC